eukprot:1023743-Prymnesium_polylepis.1
MSSLGSTRGAASEDEEPTWCRCDAMGGRTGRGGLCAMMALTSAAPQSDRRTCCLSCAGLGPPLERPRGLTRPCRAGHTRAERRQPQSADSAAPARRH